MLYTTFSLLEVYRVSSVERNKTDYTLYYKNSFVFETNKYFT